MIIGFIKGQQFSISQPTVVANANNYLEMKFIFQTSDWSGLSIWAHFTQDDKTVFEINVKNNMISKSDRLNLSEGKWKVYLHGNDPDGTMRITTEVKGLTVEKAGFICTPLPEIPLSAAEQIDQKAQRAENIANEALTEVKRVAPLAEEARNSMVQAQISASEAKTSEANAKDSEIATGGFAQTAQTAANQATTAAQTSEQNATKTDSDRQISEQSVLQNTNIAKGISADVVKNDALCKQVEADTAQVTADKATVIAAKDTAVQAAQSAESSKAVAEKSAIDAKASADAAELKLQQTTQTMQNINALAQKAESAEATATTKASEALASANLAKSSETTAVNSADKAVESARQALESQKAAALSEAESLKQANLAKESQLAASLSQAETAKNARESSLSATQALDSANDASKSATTTAQLAEQSRLSANDAEAAAQRAEAGATVAEQAIPEVKKYVADNFANAFKNQVSGEVVAVDDVSPIGHRVGCKVESKNLIPYPYTDGPKAMNGITFTPHADGSVTIDGTATEQANYFFAVGKHLDFKAGPYTVSGTPSGGSYATYYFRTLAIYADGSDATQDFDEPSTRIYKSDFFITGIVFTVKAGVSFQGETMKPQFERGSVATPYTPYIPDLSKVTVNRCNGNLSDIGTVDVVGDRIINLTIPLPAGEYYVSCKATGENSKAVVIFRDEKELIVSQPNLIFDADSVRHTLRTSLKSKATSCILRAGETYDGAIGKKSRFEDFQISLNKDTPYEKFNGIRFIPDPDGTVSDMTSLSPNMTILSNTPGVIINAEYNQDGNAVIRKLSDRIAELESKATNI